MRMHFKTKKNQLSFATEGQQMRTWICSRGRVTNNESKHRTKPNFCITTAQLEQLHNKFEQGHYCTLVEHSQIAQPCVR